MLAVEAIERRKLRFEARRFAIETLVRIQLDQASGTRTLVASHLRLMFGLSLAAIAGAVTMIGAVFRTGLTAVTLREDALTIGLIAACLGLFTLAAVFALVRSRAVARQSAAILKDPFPMAEADVRRLLSKPGPDEEEEAILDTLSRVLISRVEADRAISTSSTLVVSLILAGLATGAAGVLSAIL